MALVKQGANGALTGTLSIRPYRIIHMNNVIMMIETIVKSVLSSLPAGLDTCHEKQPLCTALQRIRTGRQGTLPPGTVTSRWS